MMNKEIAIKGIVLRITNNGEKKANDERTLRYKTIINVAMPNEVKQASMTLPKVDRKHKRLLLLISLIRVFTICVIEGYKKLFLLTLEIMIHIKNRTTIVLSEKLIRLIVEGFIW